MNENQARHLRIHFSRLLAEAEELWQWTSRLPLPERPWVRPVQVELERLRSSIRGVAGELQLDLDDPDVRPRRRVAAWSATWWGRVLDCRPTALRGYGPVDRELDRALAPAVEDIAALLRRIGSLAESAGQ